MISALLRRLRHPRRPEQPVYSGHRPLAILNEGTPAVEARIDALKADFAAMSAKQLAAFLNTSNLSLIRSARDLGRS